MERHAESTLISAEFDYGTYGVMNRRIKIPYIDKISIEREIRIAYKELDPHPPPEPLQLDEELDAEEPQ